MLTDEHNDAAPEALAIEADEDDERDTEGEAVGEREPDCDAVMVAEAH